MIIGILIEAIVGILCIVLGFLIWKKQKISLIHDYHYRNVKEEDVPSYTRQIGSGLIIIGSGILLTGMLDLLNSSLWWIPLIIGFSLGLIVIIKAQKKYNGSIMS